MSVETFHDGRVILHGGDCLDIVAGLPEARFDAIVTDPPYELGFMGRAWDKSGVAFEKATWAAFARVLKPGGHLVAFGAPKNFHRLVCAIEDAGFEVRDALMWLFGTGFPKSLDVSKAIDKAVGAKRESGVVSGRSGAARGILRRADRARGGISRLHRPAHASRSRRQYGAQGGAGQGARRSGARRPIVWGGHRVTRWYRYVRLSDFGPALWVGWRWAADLGPRHGHWSVLMVWGGPGDPPSGLEHRSNGFAGLSDG